MISGATWFAMGAYYWLTGRAADSIICGAEALISFVLIPFVGKTNRAEIVNAYLSSICVCLLAESYLSGLSLSYTPTLYCVVVLLAAYQLGPRSAWTWAAISLGCLLMIHFGMRNLPSMPGPLVTDRIIGQVGMLFLVLMFSVMAESSAERYATKLKVASDELREGSRKLKTLVGTDTLTSLSNRHRFQKDFDSALERAKVEGSRLAILLIDLNGFKQINDRMGHAAGDEVLRVVAGRLQDAVGGDGLIARLGGDEFTVIVENLPDNMAAPLIGGKIVRSISREYRLHGRDVKLGASVGAAMYPDDGDTIDDLLSHADAAMYDAKSKHLGVQLYAPSMTEEAERRQQIEEQLNEALERDEFSLFYQPQVEIATDKIVGMEALLRWKRNGEFVSPSVFIGHLEDCGSIIEVGRWVLEHACLQAKEWSKYGSDIRIAVNVSSVQFRQESFLDDVWNAIEASGIYPEMLDLELTETVFLDETREAIANIELLRETGISISIDDFGTGYSSLSYLKSLPINRLKIDRSFVKDIPNYDDGMIAETIINLSHNLGMSVLAEGVDMEAQLEYLRDRGCDEYQGFLYSRPLTAEETMMKVAAQAKSSEVSVISVPEAGLSKA